MWSNVLCGANFTRNNSLLCGKTEVIYWVSYISTLRSVVIGGAPAIRKETIIINQQQDFHKTTVPGNT